MVTRAWNTFQNVRGSLHWTPKLLCSPSLPAYCLPEIISPPKRTLPFVSYFTLPPRQFILRKCVRNLATVWSFILHTRVDVDVSLLAISSFVMRDKLHPRSLLLLQCRAPLYGCGPTKFLNCLTNWSKRWSKRSPASRILSWLLVLPRKKVWCCSKWC